MVKNGLFLISVGFLIFVLGAVGADMRITNLVPTIFALLFVIIGTIVAVMGHKKHVAQKQAKEQTDEVEL